MAVFEGVDLVALKAELLNAHYAGMSDAAAAAELNKVPSWNATDKQDRGLVSAYEVFEAIVPAEWAALTAQEKQRVQTVLSMGMVNLKGVNTRASLGAAFGAGTATRTALLALQNDFGISRATFLAATLFPGGMARDVFYYDVARARAS